jgi:hypothetical protein
MRNSAIGPAGSDRHTGLASTAGAGTVQPHPAELLTLFAGIPDADPAAVTDLGNVSGEGGHVSAGQGGEDFSSWFDSVNLVDLLGELPVSSEDPFGFGTDWGGWQT